VIRLGLCCKFHKEAIAFKTATATALQRLPRRQQLAKLAQLAIANAEALQAALNFCAAHGIGCFRVNSQILPVKTHPTVGYATGELPDAAGIVAAFTACGLFAKEHGLRLSFHPDQFILLSTPDPDILRKSLRDLEYQAEVAEWVHADVINLHAGGGYGNKPEALERLAAVIGTLSPAVRSRLTLENDDRIYTPADLLPLCRAVRIPFVYDVHHHRCLPDGLSAEEATRQALATWDREPLFHVSSPKEGPACKNPRPHHAFITPSDFPDAWHPLTLTVEVEAKAKEEAIARLRQALARKRVRLWPGPPPRCRRPPSARLPDRFVCLPHHAENAIMKKTFS